MYPLILLIMPLTACFLEYCPRAAQTLLVIEVLAALYGVCTL
jgi:hypothetical protein